MCVEQVFDLYLNPGKFVHYRPNRTNKQNMGFIQTQKLKLTVCMTVSLFVWFVRCLLVCFLYAMWHAFQFVVCLLCDISASLLFVCNMKCLPVCFLVCYVICLPVYLFVSYDKVCQTICLSGKWLSISQSDKWYVCQSLCLLVCLVTCLPICLFVW